MNRSETEVRPAFTLKSDEITEDAMQSALAVFDDWLGMGKSDEVSDKSKASVIWAIMAALAHPVPPAIPHQMPIDASNASFAELLARNEQRSGR